LIFLLNLFVTADEVCRHLSDCVDETVIGSKRLSVLYARSGNSVRVTAWGTQIPLYAAEIT